MSNMESAAAQESQGDRVYDDLRIFEEAQGLCRTAARMYIAKASFAGQEPARGSRKQSFDYPGMSVTMQFSFMRPEDDPNGALRYRAARELQYTMSALELDNLGGKAQRKLWQQNMAKYLIDTHPSCYSQDEAEYLAINALLAGAARRFEHTEYRLTPEHFILDVSKGFMVNGEHLEGEFVDGSMLVVGNREEQQERVTQQRILEATARDVESMRGSSPDGESGPWVPNSFWDIPESDDEDEDTVRLLERGIEQVVENTILEELEKEFEPKLDIYDVCKLREILSALELTK